MKWTIILLPPDLSDVIYPYIAHVEGETWVGADWKARIELAQAHLSGLDTDLDLKQYAKECTTIAVFRGWLESEF